MALIWGDTEQSQLALFLLPFVTFPWLLSPTHTFSLLEPEFQGQLKVKLDHVDEMLADVAALAGGGHTLEVMLRPV